MAERRVDRIERLLRDRGNRARLIDIVEDVRNDEGNPDLPYQSVYIAIQLENQRLADSGDRTRFVTSRDGEARGWVRLREISGFAQGTEARQLETAIHEANEKIDDAIRRWLQQMDWRVFETTFLTRVLEALGFQDCRGHATHP